MVLQTWERAQYNHITKDDLALGMQLSLWFHCQTGSYLVFNTITHVQIIEIRDIKIQYVCMLGKARDW